MKEIALTQGKVALVDDDDYERVAQLRWCAHRHHRAWYAKTQNGRRVLPMHRFVLNAMPGSLIDHRNRDGLDNQKANLRYCTEGQNQANRVKGSGTSQYKGVYWDKDRQQWAARVHFNGKAQYLGRFTEEASAALAYNEGALRCFGEFACLNDVQLRAGRI